MKKGMLMILTCFILTIIGCKTSNTIVDNTVMQYEFDTLVNKTFVDSVINADTLGNYPEAWVYTPLIDYETNKNVSTRTYYKEWQQSVYRIIEEDNNLYKFSKRVKK